MAVVTVAAVMGLIMVASAVPAFANQHEESQGGPPETFGYGRFGVDVAVDVAGNCGEGQGAEQASIPEARIVETGQGEPNEDPGVSRFAGPPFTEPWLTC